MDLIVNINKPKGITSQEATSRVKRALRSKKAGHTGTLDPAATGVLLVCLNRATRLASYFSGLDKQYRAVIKLGESTDTQDASGNVVEKTGRVEVDEAIIKNTLKSFEGDILQKPPMFSALKYKGRPLYKYARKGVEIPREQRKVHIQRIELLTINIPFVNVNVVCSKGTYIRTLCHDIGEKLGTMAHLFELERTAIESFNLQNSTTLKELQATDIDFTGGYQSLCAKRGIFTMDNALSWLPELYIKESQIKSVMNGNPVSVLPPSPSPLSPPIKGGETLESPLPLWERVRERGDFRKESYSGIKIKSPDGRFLAVGRFISGKNIVKLDVVFDI